MYDLLQFSLILYNITEIYRVGYYMEMCYLISIIKLFNKVLLKFQ